MLGIFEQTTSSDTDLYPARDPDVIACQAALQAASELAEPAAQAWKAHCAAHVDDNRSVPFSRHKQRLYDAVQDTSEALAAAETDHKKALDSATQRATAAWDDIIRQKFLDDLPAIERFIEVLRQHEETVVLAQAAGVSRALNVAHTFISANEVATRLQYARGQMGIEV